MNQRLSYFRHIVALERVKEKAWSHGGKEGPTNQAWLAVSCGSHLEHVGSAS